jgi:DNA polymerase III alpha subunit
MSIEIKELDIIKSIQKYGTDIIEHCLYHSAFEKYVNVVYEEKLPYPIPKTEINPDNWFIPDSYKNIDIEKYLVEICPKDNLQRLTKELSLYKQNNMISVLKTMKYLVDTFRENEIVWGVGRGSSVASYALFLIGVHKIDSVKYDLPIEEFFKGENNGKTIQNPAG